MAWIREGSAEIVHERSRGWAECETTRYPVEAADSFARQLQAFVAAARGEREASPTLAESIITAFTLDALLSSGAERETVEVRLPAEVGA